MVRQPAQWEDTGLADIEVLPCGLGKAGHGIPESLHCALRAGSQECHAVVYILRGTDLAPCSAEPHLWDGLQPAMEGPCHK